MKVDATDGLMTVGQLSRRTGLSVKAIRQYEALGLIYSAGTPGRGRIIASPRRRAQVMSADYVERSTTIIHGIEGLELVPHAVRLPAEGEPVTFDDLAAAAGRPPRSGRSTQAFAVDRAVATQVGWAAA